MTDFLRYIFNEIPVSEFNAVVLTWPFRTTLFVGVFFSYFIQLTMMTNFLEKPYFSNANYQKYIKEYGRNLYFAAFNLITFAGAILIIIPPIFPLRLYISLSIYVLINLLLALVGIKFDLISDMDEK